MHLEECVLQMKIHCGGCRWLKHNPTKSVAQPLLSGQVPMVW
jgi:hypothetical protein